MLLGGLEIVVGGILIHRYQTKKHEKKRLQDEALYRRHNTFPGAKPPQPYQHDPFAYPEHHIPAVAPQKYACYGTVQQSQFQPQVFPQQHIQSPFDPQHKPQCEPQPQLQPQPHPRTPIQHAPTFNIPRRPLPQQRPQLIQPLQRSDSFATISRMPVANGWRPHDVDVDVDDDNNPPSLPPRRQQSNLQPPSNSPYSVSGFSVSVPAFGSSANAPLTYVPSPTVGRQTVDDNWETYGSPPAHQDSENDPPPPYQP
ncbi:hypothetical protein BS50DRAFT_239421 [Corynespora cassiicola Philippines]|uniref:Uncharacterized protein n=1 Tax=Corynespora cassiicola Philippines TaxID=1448308 RepID=A0A2T2P2L4_CORCC|nr:hypothetical protein BS50DRAFT_239421 [Corynespora cassiicola Philippines]